MHAAAMRVLGRFACSRSRALAARTSGRAKTGSRASGVLNPSAGTTTQSAGAPAVRMVIGTDRPWAVRTRRRTPTTDTSNGGMPRSNRPISSLAVVNTSSTVDKPVSKIPSSAMTSHRMARTVSKLSVLPLAIRSRAP